MNAPFRHRSAGQREPFVAFVCDDSTAEALRPLAVEQGWSPDRVNKGGLRTAIQTLSVSASPNILFVDLSESGDPLNDINALAEVCEPGTIVLASGQVNDVRLYRGLVSSGIQDYLLKPLNPDIVRGALVQAQSTLMAPRKAEVSNRPHNAVTVIGTRGGAGGSTLATSLAWLLGERNNRNTALLDLDVHFGTGALSLDLEPSRGLIDAIENPSRIDGLFIERAMVRVSDRLAVLSAEAPINSEVRSGDDQAFHQLQEEIRNAYEYTVVDLPRAVLVEHPHLVADAQAAVLVTEFTLAAARDTIRLLSWCKGNAPHTPLILVANRVQAAGVLEIGRKEFESSVERKVDFVIGFEPKLAAQAAKLGKPLAEVGRNSKALAELPALAREVIEATDGGEEELPGKSKGRSRGGGGGGGSLLDKLKSMSKK